MRGDRVYRIYGVHGGRAADTYLGTFRTRAEAVAEVAGLLTRTMHGRNWAAQYHDRGFDIREAEVATDFEPPPPPTPRDRYLVRSTPIEPDPEQWTRMRMEVLRRGADASAPPTPVCVYERDHASFETFEPFRRGGRDYALVSTDYTRSAVLDLATGQVIAAEPEDPDGTGFCPVGFYVPDWWDVHDGSIIPGSASWRPDLHEWPRGDLGFVWGCVWGDDASWKLQALDLSRIDEGVLVRDARFGYVELATGAWTSPCFDEAWPTASRPPPFLRLSPWSGAVTVAVAMSFDLTSGRARHWQRRDPRHDDEG